MIVLVVVKRILSLCDGLSAIDDIRNGVLCSLVSDLMSMLSVVAAQQPVTTHVTVCCPSCYFCVDSCVCSTDPFCMFFVVVALSQK